jgi:DNA polymerase-3 subunit alpha
MCQAEVGDLDELTLLNGKELAVAGIVTSVTPLTTKDGRRYARFVLEDYNTRHEFAMYSKDYERFGIFIEVDNFLFIRGKVQPRYGKEGEALEYRINSVQHLAEVAENVSKIRIELDINEVCTTLTQMLLEQVQANPGKTVLEFTIHDHQEGVKVKLNSKKYRVSTSAEFMNFLINNEFNYFINI